MSNKRKREEVAKKVAEEVAKERKIFEDAGIDPNAQMPPEFDEALRQRYDEIVLSSKGGNRSRKTKRNRKDRRTKRNRKNQRTSRK